jgi:hypothetical protein
MPSCSLTERTNGESGHFINSRLSEMILSLDQILKRSPAQGFGWAVVRIIVGPRRFAFPGGIKIKRHGGKRTALPGQQNFDRQSEGHLLHGLPRPQCGGRFQKQFGPAKLSALRFIFFERSRIKIGRKIRHARHVFGKHNISHCSLLSTL